MVLDSLSINAFRNRKHPVMFNEPCGIANICAPPLRTTNDPATYRTVAAYRARGWDLLRAAPRQFLGDRPGPWAAVVAGSCGPVNVPRWLVVRDRFSRVIEPQALGVRRRTCGP
jgi:hypothetical protein